MAGRHKGTPKTGGRQKGTLNKVNAEQRAAIVESGLTPLDWMLSVLRDPAVDYDRRDRAARDSAPYVHAKLASTEVTGRDGGPIIIDKIERLIIGPNANNTDR